MRATSRADGRPDTTSADALIGADGIYSVVRAQLHPGEAPPRWSGVLMWRGTTEAEPFLTGATVAICGSNAATKFVAYPAARAGHAAVAVNWVAEAMIGGTEPPARPAGLHHENIHFYGTHSVNVDGELAKLGSDGYRPLRSPAPDAITGDS